MIFDFTAGSLSSAERRALKEDCAPSFGTAYRFDLLAGKIFFNTRITSFKVFLMLEVVCVCREELMVREEGRALYLSKQDAGHKY